MISLEDFSRYATIIPQEHIPALHGSLKKIPDFSWLLSKPHRSLGRLQGDLLKDFPTIFLDESRVARLRNFTVMVLNNTCDLPEERLEFVTIAPIVDFNEYLKFERARRMSSTKEDNKKIEESVRGYADAIRKNNKTEILYLPSFDGFPNGALVLLHMVSSVSAKIYYDSLKSESRIASFTQTGFYFLLIKLTSHLARAEGQEVNRDS